MTRRQRVLIVDDSEMIRKLVAARLRDLSVEMVEAASGGEGIDEAIEQNPDLILLDVDMPDMSGFEVCQQLKKDPQTSDIPVIFLTGSDDPAAKIRAFELGAVDYVTKPFDAAEMRARVGAALRTQALLEMLATKANTDELTGLPNRSHFTEALTRCIERASVDHAYRFCVLFLDLDRFKLINDSLGHIVGDELLVHVARKLRKCVRLDDRADPGPGSARSRDMVARMGGDEFTILLDDVPDQQVPITVAQRVCEELGRPFILSGQAVNTTVSIGVRMCDHTCDSPDTLLRDCDLAMYHAKSAGKARHAVFDEKMHTEAMTRLQLENDLRFAIAQRQLELHYQPVVSLESGDLLGFEALLRWMHPQRGVVMPTQFVPIAEETGLIIEIGGWVMRQACTQLQRWRRMIPRRRPLHMCINLSKAQMTDPDLIENIRDLLRKTNVDPQSLNFEVTESEIMEDPHMVVRALEQVRGLGVRTAMDDFGTGSSSLASLHHFPIDVLKIDRAFVQSMGRSRAHAAIVHAIVSLAQNLNMEVVAEGVETHDQLVQLQALDCNHAQGYLFSQPLPAAAAENMLLARAPFARTA
jgi:predicted signal transduction protein with EAL and GGDEF domain